MVQLEEGQEVFQKFPRVIDEGGREWFGGNQAWYAGHTQQQAGCGPVAFANLLAVHAAGRPGFAKSIGLQFMPNGRIAKVDFVALMERIYAVMGSMEIPVLREAAESRHKKVQLMLASQDAALVNKGKKMQGSKISRMVASLGNSTGTFEWGAKRFARQAGFECRAHTLRTLGAGGEKGLALIREGLACGQPVMLLTHFNRHELLLYRNGLEKQPEAACLKVPHFLTVVGLRGSERDAPELIVSTWGLVAGVPYESLSHSWRTPLAVRSSLSYYEVL